MLCTSTATAAPPFVCVFCPLTDGCSELQAAAAATSSGNIVGELISSEISCAEWTSVEVTDNKLKLVAGGSGSDVYMFNNIRFVVSASAVLRVDASVEFTGDDAQVDLQALLCAREESESLVRICRARREPLFVQVHPTQSNNLVTSIHVY